MTDTDFAIQQKVMRSTLHFRTLRQRIDRYLKSNANSADNDFNSEPDYLIVRARTRRPPPPSLSVEIGEYLYNARASLDYTACELARYNKQTIDNYVEYPIFLERDDFWNPVTGKYQDGVKRRLRKLAPKHRTIIEGQQPFERRDGAPEDDPLWLLYCLSNHDRHQFIHPVSTVTRESFHHFTPPSADKRFEQVEVRYGAFKDNAEIARFRILPGPAVAVSVETQVRCDVAFDEEGPSAGRSVLNTLGGIGVRVGEIIQDFRDTLG